MGPGIPNPMLWGSSDPLDELGKIERSVRFRAAATASFGRSPASVSSDKTWTCSLWVKRGKLGAYQSIFNAYTSGTDMSTIYFDTSDDLRVDNYRGSSVKTRRATSLLRDPAALYHVVVSCNAGTPNIYVQGVQNVDASKSVGPDSSSWLFNYTAAHEIGKAIGTGYLDATLSHFCWIDGQAITPAAFGQFHPRTGQWRPKSREAIRAAVAVGGGARNGWGVDGFFLPFGPSDFSGTTVYDRSQSDTDTTGNNWTLNNINVTTPGPTYDLMLDTPTNNFCVLNPVASVGMTLANGNLDFTTSLATTPQNGFGTVPMRKGKFQFEVQPTSISSNNSTVVIGICGSTSNVSEFYSQPTGYAYRGNGQKCSNGGAFVAYGSALALNDIVGGVFDADLGTLEFFLNGVSMGVAFTGIPAGDYVVALADTGTTVNWGGNINCGQRPFAYPVVGAKGISTKNLPVRYPVMQSAGAFVAKTDSGANIKTALEAASPWDKWIRIYKRRDAAEGWRWQFWDDTANFLDSSSTAAKAAFPALAGTSYVGYAIKVSAQNGVATGQLVHTSGVADVVVDGMSNSRKTILLKNEAIGSWFWYHPNLTAGKLLYLDDATTGETTDGTISSITSSGFTVAAALASGTYRWIVFADTPGFLSIGGFTTNGVADGPFMQMGISPALALFRIKPSGDLPILDAARNPTNLANSVLYLDGTDPETSPSTINNGDLISNGFKSRCATSAPEDINYNSGTGGIYVAFGQPFRYSNAR